MANLMGVLIARRAALGAEIRTRGLRETGPGLVAYASTAVHGSVVRAMDLAGLGTASLRLISVNDDHQMDIPELQATIDADRAAGLRPFLRYGNGRDSGCRGDRRSRDPRRYRTA